MRKLLFAAVTGASLLVALVAGSLALADHGKGSSRISAKLDGYSETPSISTVARGEFRARINRSANTIDYTLTYSDLEGGAVSAAHIHLGERHTAGGIAAFLCGGGDKPPCPAPGIAVSGTIDPADVMAIPAQGLLAGEMAALIRAIKAGATYVNVHTAAHGGGEIRGQIRGGGRGDD